MARTKDASQRSSISRTEIIDLEKLGRTRPLVFKSALAEILFCSSLLLSLATAAYFISGFHTLLPSLVYHLHIPHGSYTWPSSILTLIACATLLPIGRLADMYGGYLVYNFGLFIFSISSLAAGFSPNYITLIAFRAAQGLGAAAFLPAGIMLLGKTYRPGPRKNYVFSLYGAASPITFFAGILAGGIAAEKGVWRAYFWFGSLASFVGSLIGWFAIPRDRGDKEAKMDWWGLVTLTPGLFLVVFAITQSSVASRGWATPYIYVSAVLGSISLGAGIYVEGYVSSAPFIPGEILRAKNMKRMLFCLALSYGVFGIFLFYSNFYFELVLHRSPLQTALYFAPWAILGLILALTSGLLLHLLPGRALLIFTGLANLTALLFLALLPSKPNYWLHIMPAMLAETACADVVFTVSNVFITTSLPAKYQGLAGSLINLMLYLGICLFLGIADTVVEGARGAGMELGEAYRIVFWVGVGTAAVALGVFCCMDVGTAGAALTNDEREGEDTDITVVVCVKEDA